MGGPSKASGMYIRMHCAYLYLPLVLSMGLTEVEAVAEQDRRGDCNLRPATTEGGKETAFVSKIKLRRTSIYSQNRRHYEPQCGRRCPNIYPSRIPVAKRNWGKGERKGRPREGGGGGEETTHNWSLRQTSRMKEQ